MVEFGVLSSRSTVQKRASSQAGSDPISELYERHREELLSYALSIAKNRDLAEDAVQQAFCNTISSFRRGVEVENCNQWLKRCVRNACLDLLRRQRTTVSLSSLEDPVTFEDPSSTFSAHMCLAATTEAIADLPSHLRTALVLADVENLSYQEISSRMGRSVSSVRQLIFRARARVRVAVA